MQADEEQTRISKLEQALDSKDAVIARLRSELDRLRREQLDKEDFQGTSELRKRIKGLKGRTRRGA